MTTPIGPNLITEDSKQGSHGFLASSHFKIGQDNSVIPQSMKSVFKKDYVPWEVESKPAAAKPPDPAHILHSDDRFFSQRNSETQTAYEEKAIPQPDLKKDKYQALSATNFKMDSDVSKFDSFKTTQKLDFVPRDLGYNKAHLPGHPMRSNIPDGDKEKAPQPLSDYRDRYRGHDVITNKVEKAAPALDGPPTIQGDQRQHHFNTTHVATYKGVSLPRILPMEAQRQSNIPQGDKDKETLQRTVFQDSYIQHDVGKGEAVDSRKLQETSVKQHDGHGTWNTYMTTFKDSYRPVSGGFVRDGLACDRNHSDFPLGDEHALRNMDRATMTTNRFYMGNPPQTVKPQIEDGSAKRTQSNVPFGEPRLNDTYYETTNKAVYKPQEAPYGLSKPGMMTESVIPLDYYPNEVHNTTMRTDFVNPEQEKLMPNQKAIDRIAAAHIMPPIKGTGTYSTEHKEQYIPKSSLRGTYDPVRLQRSSVPIGTLHY